MQSQFKILILFLINFWTQISMHKLNIFSTKKFPSFFYPNLLPLFPYPKKKKDSHMFGKDLIFFSYGDQEGKRIRRRIKRERRTSDEYEERRCRDIFCRTGRIQARGLLNFKAE